jgi:hypothetical protein
LGRMATGARWLLSSINVAKMEWRGVGTDTPVGIEKKKEKTNLRNIFPAPHVKKRRKFTKKISSAPY